MRFLLVSLLLQAPAWASEPSGYVVKIEAGAVYLDAGAEGGASPGRDFTLYTEGEELRHPVTGASLGKVETLLGRGRVETAAEKYSLGRLDPPEAAAPLASKIPRLRFRFAGAPQPPAPAPAPATYPPAVAGQPAAGSRQPSWRSAPIELDAVDMAAGDADGDGRTDVLLADADHVTAYSVEGTGLKPVCRFEDKSTGARILALDAADLNGNGRAEAFVTVHNSFLGRIESYALECKDGVFERLAALPYMTRAYQDAAGTWRIGAQQLVADRTFPFGAIYPLEFKDGRYALGGQSLKTQRLEWIYSFAAAPDAAGGAPYTLFYTNTDLLRIQFKKGHWLSSEGFGQTSSRLRWYDRVVQFRPRLAVTQSQGGFEGVYALKNVASFGGLSGVFGVFGSAELHRLHWNGLGLDPEWHAELAGYAADLALVSPAAGQPAELWVAVVGRGGRTSLWKFQP